ncbi:hypothetical protein EU528_02570 [Candidatus Thorarchaeota archaeon]|nr:MAG: hypothetical protein EU528_02570 [Candidatus Thorarchaeota archaeon]
MQDIVAIAALMREISFGILLAGLFYTFGMFFLGRLFSAISEHEHEVEHDVDHDVEHDVDHDMDHEIEHSIEHEVEHDIDHGVDHDFDHEVEHDYEHDIEHDLDHHVELDHDLDHDVEHDVEHEAEHDVDHHVEKDFEHHVEVDHDIEKDHSGFFELDRGAPLGVTIGTSLVLFGFLGSVIYYEGILVPFIAKVMFQFGATILLVWTMRTILGKIFVESGFNIKPQHLVGMEVEAVSTIRDDFGEVRAETEMGLRRFNARPFQKGIIFQRGTDLFVISADEKFVYVDPRKEAVKWVQKQSKSPEKTEE